MSRCSLSVDIYSIQWRFIRVQTRGIIVWHRLKFPVRVDRWITRDPSQVPPNALKKLCQKYVERDGFGLLTVLSTRVFDFPAYFFTKRPPSETLPSHDWPRTGLLPKMCGALHDIRVLSVWSRSLQGRWLVHTSLSAEYLQTEKVLHSDDQIFVVCWILSVQRCPNQTRISEDEREHQLIRRDQGGVCPGSPGGPRAIHTLSLGQPEIFGAAP